MARPPRIESRELVQQIGVVRPNPVGESGLLVAGRMLGQFAGEVAQEEQAQRIDTAKQEGFSTGLMRDESGNLLPVELRANDSPENRAFNAAITNSYLDGLENDYRRQAVELQAASGGDPTDFQVRMDTYIRERVARLPDELKSRGQHIGDGIGLQTFNGMLNADRVRGHRNAQNEWQAKQAARTSDILVMAQAGETDSEAYANALARLTEHNLEGVQAGYWTEEAASLDLQMVADEGEANAMVSVALKAYERAGGGASGLAAAQEIAEQIQTDTGLTMDPSKRGQYSRQIMAQVNQLEIQREAQIRQARTEASRAIDVAAKRMYAGVDIPASEAGRITTLVNNSGDPDLMREWRDQQSLSGDVKTWQTMGPGELSAQIEMSLRPAVASDGATPMEFARLNAAETVLSNVARNVQADPLAYAERVGLTSLQPVDPFSAPSLQVRAQSADQVSAKYGTKFKLWTEPEVESLTQQMALAAPEERVAFARSIAAALPGNQSAAAFEQLSKTDPGLAYIGGMVSRDPRLEPTAVNIERGHRIRAENKDWMKGSNVMESQLAEVLNQYQPVLMVLADGTMDAVREAATSDFAARGGTDIREFEESLNRVLGKVGDGGGIQRVNGVDTLMPVGVTDNDFEDAIGRLDLTSMSALSRTGMPPVYTDGRIVSPRDFEDAQFVSVANNRYLIRIENGYLKDINGVNYEITLTPETVARLAN